MQPYLSRWLRSFRSRLLWNVHGERKPDSYGDQENQKNAISVNWWTFTERQDVAQEPGSANSRPGLSASVPASTRSRATASTRSILVWQRTAAAASTRSTVLRAIIYRCRGRAGIVLYVEFHANPHIPHISASSLRSQSTIFANNTHCGSHCSHG